MAGAMPLLPGQLQVSHRTVSANGVRLHVVEKGEGPCVLLLHGFPESWWCWRYQIDPLVNAGYRVIAPDLRGYGESDVQGPWDLETIAADVVALLQALCGEERVHLVGHDWGGIVAWHLAAHRPDRFHSLAVFNCPHPAQFRKALLTRPRQLRRSWYVFAFQVPVVPERMLTRDGGAPLLRMYRGNARDRSNFSDAELRPFVEALLRPGQASAMIGWYRSSFRTSVRHYPRIRLPALLGWGMDDRALGYDDLIPGTERWVEGLRIERVEGVGHFITAEAPDWVNGQLLSFLRGPAAVSRPEAAAATGSARAGGG